MQSVTFRDAQPSEAGRIVEFQVRMARETEHLDLDAITCRRGVDAVFEDPTKGRYFVADREGEVVGSLLVTYEWSDWRGLTVWWIQSVFVVSEMRRQGVYAGLYRHVRELVDQEPDVAGIRLYVDRRNTPAQEVYRRLGMNGEHYLVYEWMKDF